MKTSKVFTTARFNPFWLTTVPTNNHLPLASGPIAVRIREVGLIEGDNYAPSMVKFLNQFSRKCRSHTVEQNQYLSMLLESFLNACAELPEDAFLNKKNRRFNVALYEAAFGSICSSAFREKRLLNGAISAVHLAQLEDDKQFLDATIEGTTQTKNVKARLNRAKAVLGAL